MLALLLPKVPLKLREFAYFGFGITLVSASIAHYSRGDGIMFVIDPMIFLGALIVSYRSLPPLRKTTLAASATTAV